MNKKLSIASITYMISCIVLSVPSNTWANDSGSFKLATGFDYTSGKYGSSDSTDIISIPVIGMFQSESWFVKLSIPYTQVYGYGDLVIGGRRIKNPNTTSITTTTTKTTKSGLGDVLATVTYNVYSGNENNFGIDLTGKIKFGTASTNLGTGENDYAAQVGSYQRWGNFTSMLSLGHYFLGDPVDIDLNNISYGILSGDYQFNDHINCGVEMTTAEKSSDFDEAQKDLTFYISKKMDNNLNFRIYVLKGYSDGSADSGFGAQVSIDL